MADSFLIKEEILLDCEESILYRPNGANPKKQSMFKLREASFSLDRKL